jgi:hypothetical protein
VLKTLQIKIRFLGGDDIREQLKLAGERQLTALVEWARHIPHFLDLPVGDQVSDQRLVDLHVGDQELISDKLTCL